MSTKPSKTEKGACQIVDLTPENIGEFGVCGYKDAAKNPALKRKIDWFSDLYPKGLRIKSIVFPHAGSQGMVEYMPGEHAHRPVSAPGYLFIQCLFVGFKKEYKGRGHASRLIGEVIAEAKAAGKRGVAVVTRRGSFMAKKEIFLKKGFALVGEVQPDFELLALKFEPKSPDPKFLEMEGKVERFGRGLVILRSAQCPYSVKNVEAILATARKMGLEAELVDLPDAAAVRETPCAFGTFCIIHDGEIISHHPISNTRFENIMSTRKKCGLA